MLVLILKDMISLLESSPGIHSRSPRWFGSTGTRVAYRRGQRESNEEALSQRKIVLKC